MRPIGRTADPGMVPPIDPDAFVVDDVLRWVGGASKVRPGWPHHQGLCDGVINFADRSAWEADPVGRRS
jgi:hypothetical protein